MKPAEAQSLSERLKSEIGSCLASDLRAHMKRGAVVVVDGKLPLLEVAVAVAQDNVTAVQGWIAAERMKNPTPGQIEAWEKAPERPFRVVIVRPYVLVQELAPQED